MSAEAAPSATGNASILLLEFPFRESAVQQLAAELNALLAGLPLVAPSLSAWVATSAAVATCYINGAVSTSLGEIHSITTAKLASVVAGTVELSRLQNVAVHTGASPDARADFHYVVRTDVEAGGDDELQRWYDEEHMAMLAAVSGTVRARRFVSLDATPRYYACYDLVAPEVLTSAQWLKARRTPWSEKVRPTFRNTRRVISRKLDLTGRSNNT
ncbi:MAG: hypothetical protein V4603_09485 [Pseudomonadota bacterium]